MSSTGNEDQPNLRLASSINNRHVLVEAFQPERIFDLADKDDLSLSAGACEILEFREQDLILKEERQQLKDKRRKFAIQRNRSATGARATQDLGAVPRMPNCAPRRPAKPNCNNSARSSRPRSRPSGRPLPAKEPREAELQQQRAQLETSVQSLGADLRAKEAHEAELQQEREQLKTSVQSLDAELRAKEASETELRREYAEVKISFQTLQDSFRTNQTRDQALKQELDQLKNSAENQQKLLRQELKQSTEQKDALLRSTEQRYNTWLRQLENNAEDLFASWRWRAGCFIVRIAELALRRGNVRLSADHMREVFAQINAYRVRKTGDLTPKKLDASEHGRLTAPASKRKRLGRSFPPGRYHRLHPQRPGGRSSLSPVDHRSYARTLPAAAGR